MKVIRTYTCPYCLVGFRRLKEATDCMLFCEPYHLMDEVIE